MANRAACGSEFERTICKELSLVISERKTDSLLWRTSASGARSTIRARQNKHLDQCGDISSTDACSKWLTDMILFELKNGYNEAFNILKVMTNPHSSNIYKWFLKAWDEASEHKRLHIVLILNWKRHGRYVVIESSFISDLYDNGVVLCDDYRHVMVHSEEYDFYIFSYDNFCEALEVHKNQFEHISKEWVKRR